MIDLIITFAIIFIAFAPAIRKGTLSAAKKSGLVKKISPGSFGDITLDGNVISKRGRGVLSHSENASG